jgi:phosphatidylserine/phosphatidylglycerophosphate/cardiolipin synthase-like enzyme
MQPRPVPAENSTEPKGRLEHKLVTGFFSGRRMKHGGYFDVQRDGPEIFFHSQRAKIDGKAVSQLVKFIQGAKHSLDVAIYDMWNPDVLKALKAMSTKVQLNILYDAGKAGGGSTTVDPKVSITAQAINAAGLKAFAQPVKEKGGHLMHDKFIVRDGASVWSGSGNFTNGGLLLQDNNFFIMDSPAAAAAYSKTLVLQCAVRSIRGLAPNCR